MKIRGGRRMTREGREEEEYIQDPRMAEEVRGREGPRGNT
jgi:hypothetical protein